MSKKFKLASNTEIVLRTIEATGCMRFIDIQKLFWKLGHPGKDVSLMGRGDYCTYLLGGPFYHEGVLHSFCEKGQDGLWRVKSEIAPPWKKLAVHHSVGRGYVWPE